MCGRFTLATPTEILAGLFEVASGPLAELGPRYNIAPTQSVAIVRAPDAPSGRELAMARWGLIPAWASDPDVGARMINARSETVAEKPAFRLAFRQRRCILPADGFYEWRSGPSGKEPFYFRAEDERPLGLAGLWERWRAPDGAVIESCTILTTDANATVSPVHARMPVILGGADYATWLDSALSDPGRLLALLVPSPSAALVGYPVSKRVNSPANDDAALVLSIAG